MSAPKNIMEVSEGEKAMLLALRRAGLAVTPYTGSAAINETINASLHQVNETTPVTRRCIAQGRGDTQCIKDAGHGQRHRYGPPPVNATTHTAPTRLWQRVTQVPLKSGSKTFTLCVGNPCTLLREGSSKVNGFKVVSIEKHSDGRVNVEITHPRRGLTRIVPLDRIEYKRPPKVSA